MTEARIQAVAFDCYGTLVDFGDEAFARAYGEICAGQGLAIDGKAFYDKWMEVWRRLAQAGQSADTGTVAVGDHAGPPHPAHHTPAAGRNRSFDGPPPPFRPYREEWPEHFAICFEELGAKGNPVAAYESLRHILCAASAFPESRRVVERLGGRLPLALLSNADDDFLLPCLSRNALDFPVTVSSESARAYKPHVSIFTTLSEALGVPRESILYVGDSRFADVAGAKNAGMLAAWVNRKTAVNRPLEAVDSGAGGATEQRRERPLPQPDYEIDSLEGLVDIVSGRRPAER